MIRLRWTCGHESRGEDVPPSPICPTCGTRTIARVWAPPPRFSGAGAGPCMKEGSYATDRPLIRAPQD